MRCCFKIHSPAGSLPNLSTCLVYRQTASSTNPTSCSLHFPGSIFPAVPQSCSAATSHVPVRGSAQPRHPLGPHGPLSTTGTCPSVERKIRFGCHLPSQERKNLSNKTRF